LAIAAGYGMFRGRIFLPSEMSFQVVTIGLLAAAVVSLHRVSRGGVAILLLLLYGVGQIGLASAAGWVPAVGGLLFGAGLWLVSLVFDLLGRGGGLAFGKFLILGPLLAGVYLAVLPMTTFHSLTADGALREVMLRLLLGLIVGDGVGLGVELAELLDRPGSGRPAGTEPAVG
jgi:hypothetical protein